MKLSARRRGDGPDAHGARLADQLFQAYLKQVLVATLLRIHRTASECGLFVPSELTLLGKTLLQLDEIGKVLDPSFDPNAAIRYHAAEILSVGLERGAMQGSLLGIVLAALIVGAALLMRVETTFRLFGYPGFAILCFIAAAAGACWLLVAIFVQDRKKRKKTTIGLR